MEPARDVTAATTTEEDRALMLRLQSGDETALAPLMNHWELPTKAVIARLVLNSSEADELAQETFVRVWQQREKFRPDAEFRPWLFAIAVNLARNRLRWWRRRPVVSLDAWMQDSPGNSGPAAEDAATQGAAGLERAEMAAAVRDAIAALPTDLREAIVLFEYEDMSQAEIAAIMGATTKAVETRIHRARERLRASLRHLA